MRDESKPIASSVPAPAAPEPGYSCAICGVKVPGLLVGGLTASSADPNRPNDPTQAAGAAKTATAHRFRPFCSARCQRIDLGNWLDERYIVPGPPVPTDGGDEADSERGETQESRRG